MEPRDASVLLPGPIAADLLALADAAHPHECCGLLFGAAGRIDKALASPNRAADPARRFEIDAAMLIGAERRSRAGDLPLIGYFHSHPDGGLTPSPRDAAEAAGDGRLWLIIAGGTITAWRNRRGGALHDAFDPLRIVAEPASS